MGIVIDYRLPEKNYRVRTYKGGKEIHKGYYNTLREAQIAKASHHWLDGQEPNPNDYFGFVYIVEDTLTGMKYVGSKQYYFYKGGGSGDCKNAPSDIEGIKDNMECFDESDWRTYCTSSNLLSHIIKERPQDFKMRILSQFKNRLDLHLAEIAVQKELDVLNTKLSNGQRKFYNQHIGRCEYNVIPQYTQQKIGLKYNPWYSLWKDLKGKMAPYWEENPSKFCEWCEKNSTEEKRILGKIQKKKPYATWNCVFMEK